MGILLVGLLGSALAFAATGGDNVVLRQTYSGNVDYVANGASFRLDPNGTDACSFPAGPMSSTVSIDIPIGANVLDAYLYFAGSAEGLAINLATQNLTLNGVPLNVSAGFNEIDYVELEDVLLDDIDFFGARRDVTSIVTGPGAYTFAGLDVSQTAFRAANQTCLGAWGLVVIYEDTTIAQIRVINLFDGFQFYQNGTFDLQPRNFVVDSVTPAGKMTHISFEGDETLATAGEQFLFSPDGLTFTPLPNPPPASGSGQPNSVDNQYDSTVTGPAPFFNRADEWGLDIDTYSLNGLLSGGDFEAVTRYNTGQDLVLLMAEVIQIDNKPLADIEVTLNDIGTFQTGTTNSAQYLISVQNNGDGIVGSTTAFAEGFMHIYNTLPAGISIDSLSDITAPGWDCTDTVLATNQVLCTYDLSSLSDSNGNSIGDLDPGESLPDILITVDVASPTSPVTSIAYVTNCGNDPDTCTTFDNKHNDSTQFDPINFFESTEDLFDIFVKSVINNNVDAEVTPIITGIPSDLSTSEKSVAGGTNGTVQPGDVLTYTITLTESSGVTDALDVTITDNIDPDTNNYVFGSNTCGGGSGTFSVGVLTIPGNTVTAGTSCIVTFNVTVPISASTGTSIDNTAGITSTNGDGATPAAPTLLVAGVATGSKILYFDTLGGSPILTRDAPASDSTITLANGASTTLTLSPLLQSDLQINSGVIPISLWVEALTTSGPTYSVTVDLEYQSGTTIGSDTVAGVTMTSGSGNAQLFPFQITLGSDITDLTSGENITLDITNNSTNEITIHALLNSIDSKLVIDAEDVINVDNVLFFSDLLRTIPVITPGTIDAGETIYIEAIISDPFGFEDITDARLTLIDPNLGNQLTSVAMTEELPSSGGTKTYTYAYSIPDATSIGPGIWIAQVTGFEGDEGTVTHTEVGSFTTAAPEVSVAYTVDKLTAVPGETLTYTITITNDGGSTSLDISQLVPVGTNSVSVITLPSGTDTSSGTTLDIQNIIAGTGTTVIEFTVAVLAGAQPGDLIDHTISLDNMGTNVEDIAPSVLISPFGFATGNKPIYADALNAVPRFDRTTPTTDTTTTIDSQGDSQLFTLSPVLQSALTLDTGDITASIWVSRGNTSFAGQRIVEATLGYNGALNGTVGTDAVTIQLAGGAPNAQYLPFTFNLGAPLVLPANTSLTLMITNDTTITGETITIHSLLSSNPSLISLNASSPLNPLSPLTITAIEYFTDSADSAGIAITDAAPGDTIWVRATVSDPFGRDDITGATLTIEDPNALETLAATSMTVPTTQPVSTAEKYFELSHLLSAELGDWTTTVTAVEGVEGVVAETESAIINVNNNAPDLTDSFKIVTNTTTSDNNNNNPGDTLHYTIALINAGLAAATGVDVTDNIPTNTSFVAGSFTIDTVVQTDPGDPIALTGLTVPASSTVTIEFDVTIDPGTTVGSLISNSALIESDDSADITVNAEDLLLAGPPAAGTKLFYLENLDSTAIITRVEPQTKDDADFVFLDNAGGSVTIDLDVPLRKDISIDPSDGDIVVTLRVEGSNANDSNRNTTVTLGYQNGGPVTIIGSQTQFIRLFTNNITTEVFTIPVSSIINIPTGNQLQLTVTNNHSVNRDINLYSYDEEGDSVRSSVALVPSPVINVDEISFWTDTMGAGTQVTNVNPTVATDIYAKVVISDPFGEADIQAPDAATNPTAIVITDPDTSATNEGINTACTAPCYAYDGEDTTNDVAGDATRTFYFIVRLTATPPATRGTWTVQVTANEGLEGDIFHVAADDFTTSLDANLSTSTKTHDAVGDIGIGDSMTYTTTLNNTGGVDADNVTFSDTLQTTPVALTFNSASTTCTDELAAALPSPAFSAGDVTLSNISVTAASSCTITISVTVGAGTAGQLINNSANIVNPSGAGATPAAPTIIYLESQIPIAGNKQLYLDNLDSGTRNLTRTQPTSTTQITLAKSESVTIDLTAPTTRLMELANGSIGVSLYLSETGQNSNRLTNVELFVDPDGGGALPFQSIDSEEQNLNLTDTPLKRTLNLTYAPDSGLPLSLGVGSVFRLVIENTTPQNGTRNLVINSDFGGIYSELVMPLINPIEVTELKFYDASATDTGAGAASCEVTFSCGAEVVDPAFVAAGTIIWVRATGADGFGSFDVNTGCDGVTSTNCPTVTVTNPSSTSTTDPMIFVQAPDTSSRQYEFSILAGGMGQDGIWQVEVEFSEGIEGVISDTSLTTFERYTPPILAVMKSVTGNTSPNQVVTYTSVTTHSSGGVASNVILTNIMGDFIEIQLDDNGGTWTALFSLTPGYTVSSESFRDVTDFTYDPNTEGVCALPAASPCYDPAILEWRIQLTEDFPIGGSVTHEYRAMIH